MVALCRLESRPLAMLKLARFGLNIKCFVQHGVLGPWLRLISVSGCPFNLQFANVKHPALGKKPLKWKPLVR
jgi:hypothetical protein